MEKDGEVVSQRDADHAQDLIRMGFCMFCVGAMLCEWFMLSGVRTIALHLGVPAFLLRILLSFMVHRARKKTMDKPKLGERSG